MGGFPPFATMRTTYLITCENNSGFHEDLENLLRLNGQAWRGEPYFCGLNWYESKSGHPAEASEEMCKELRLACLENSIGETVKE